MLCRHEIRYRQMHSLKIKLIFFHQVSESNSNVKTASIIVRPLSRKDIFYSRSIYNIDDTSNTNEKVFTCVRLREGIHECL